MKFYGNKSFIVLRLALSAAVVAGVVAVCLSLPHIHATTVSLVLLLVVLILASRWGFGEAALAAGLGAMALAYFFFPPDGWGIATPEDWVAVCAFLAVAGVTSHLASRARRQAKEAVSRRRELERLDAFGQDFPIDGSPGAMVAASLDSLVGIFQVEGVAFYHQGTGDITRSGPKQSAISADLLCHAVGHPNVSSDRATGSLLVSIRCDRHPIGNMAVCGGMSELTLRAIADRIEAGLEKVRAREELRQVDEARKSQELKMALLDSLVHEIKTPLSIIKTAVSSLLSRVSDPASRSELLTIINEESDRMDTSINEALESAGRRWGTAIEERSTRYWTVGQRYSERTQTCSTKPVSQTRRFRHSTAGELRFSHDQGSVEGTDDQCGEVFPYGFTSDHFRATVRGRDCDQRFGLRNRS